MKKIVQFEYRVLKIKASRGAKLEEFEINTCLDSLYEASSLHANRVKADFERLLIVCDVVDVTDDYKDYFNTVRTKA